MKKRLLLVGWDSADWKIMHPLIDAGHLPGIARLVETGVSGNLSTLEPQLSPMLWTSIATGKMAYHHGVPGFTEVDARNGRVVPVSAATRQCKTLWEMLGERGLRSHVVSWFATQGEQGLDGKMVSNMFCHTHGAKEGVAPDDWPPPPPGTYWPPELEQEMNGLRVAPHEISPDEVMRLFVPNADQIDQKKDRRLWALAVRLAEASSAHSAATHLMETDPDWDFFAVYYRAIDEICHQFMHYHPPKMEGVKQEDFEMYQHVVNAAYRLHDLFLCRLLNLAGPDTAVVLVSDHGFHSDHLRPRFTPRVPAGITVWHRPHGAFIASGPGFAKDSLLYGARLLDVAPTILHWFGLPVGRDMEGRVLGQAFSEQRAVESIDSWERADDAPRPRADLGPDGGKALLEQFAALGYIDEVPDDSGQAAEGTQRENDWNMARACIYGGRYQQALPLLEGCFHACPHRNDFAQQLATCQLELGLLDEAEATISRALESLKEHGGAEIIRASIALQKDQPAEALAALERAGEHATSNQARLVRARAYLALRKWDRAEATAREVLAADPQEPQAFLILARVGLNRGEADAAVDAALEAIGLQYGNPLGHLLLGTALSARNDWPEACVALKNCLALAPRHARAHRLLARARKACGDHQAAADSEQQARLSLHLLRDEEEQRLARVRSELAVRQAARDEADAERRAKIEKLKADYEALPELDLLLVSGLPRSGTSLMMQILRAGGIEPMTDGRREADEDNPEGYWEWEDIKRLPKDPRVLEQVGERAVKTVSALIAHLPGKHHYRVIYMVRPVGEIIDSQWKMLARLGKDPAAEKDHLIANQEQHSRQIRAALHKSEKIEVLEIDYPALVADPEPQLEKLAAFLGERFTFNDAVRACIRPELHRNRG